MADAAAAPPVEPTPNLGTYQAVTWSLTGIILASFTGFALIYAYVRRRRLRASLKFDSAEFITARGQVGRRPTGLHGARQCWLPSCAGAAQVPPAGLASGAAAAACAAHP